MRKLAFEENDDVVKGKVKPLVEVIDRINKKLPFPLHMQKKKTISLEEFPQKVCISKYVVLKSKP